MFSFAQLLRLSNGLDQQKSLELMKNIEENRPFIQESGPVILRWSGGGLSVFYLFVHLLYSLFSYLFYTHELEVSKLLKLPFFATLNN